LEMVCRKRSRCWRSKSYRWRIQRPNLLPCRKTIYAGARSQRVYRMETPVVIANAFLGHGQFDQLSPPATFGTHTSQRIGNRAFPKLLSRSFGNRTQKGTPAARNKAAGGDVGSRDNPEAQENSERLNQHLAPCALYGLGKPQDRQ